MCTCRPVLALFPRDPGEHTGVSQSNLLLLWLSFRLLKSLGVMANTLASPTFTVSSIYMVPKSECFAKSLGFAIEAG